MASQLDQSYTGDFGNTPGSMKPCSNSGNLPSNLPGPANLGGEVGQLEGGWPHSLDQSTQFDSFFEPSLGSTVGESMGTIDKSDSLDSYMDNSLGGKIS